MEDAALAIAEALRYPVLALGLAALAVAIFQVGELSVELWHRRRRRGSPTLFVRSAEAQALLAKGQREQAKRVLAGSSPSASVTRVLDFMVAEHGQPGAEDRIAKSLADYDLQALRRLERSRFLVRAGPGLGLMGTLIPLSPALSALGRGDLEQLSDALRVAFGITVIGILVGLLAFGVSLVRERLYAQDHSDLEYAAAALNPGAV